MLLHGNINVNGGSAFLLFKWPRQPDFVLAPEGGPGWKRTWKKATALTSVAGDCRKNVLSAHLTSTVVSLMLLVLSGHAMHGTTHGSRRDGGLPPGTGGFTSFTDLIQAIREYTCHQRSCVGKVRALLCEWKSNLRKCCSTHINLSIHCYYYYENLLKILA